MTTPQLLYGFVAAAIERAHERIFALREQMSVSIEARADVLVAHAAFQLQRIGAVVGHEGGRGVAE